MQHAGLFRILIRDAVAIFVAMAVYAGTGAKCVKNALMPDIWRLEGHVTPCRGALLSIGQKMNELTVEIREGICEFAALSL